MPGYPERVGNVVATGEFVLGYENESGLYAPSPWIYPEHDPEQLLPTFPMGSGDLEGKRDFGKHGTYLVYRKLAQDVAGFWNYFAEQTRRNGGPRNVDEMIYLASKCIGRWPSGAPLALAPEKDDPELGDDDARNDNFFYFKRDREGYACPISSHIRRANPRDSRVREPDRKFALSSSDKHRIIRRGVSFGEDLFPRDDIEYGKIPENLQDDGQLRGIHFLALNASIRAQFEFVQVTWCQNAYFDALNNNKDPIIGHNDGKGTMQIPRKPVRRLLLNLPRFGTVRGGAYFFLPSITALRYLAQLP
jgi:Dyp-type peroxidase family